MNTNHRPKDIFWNQCNASDVLQSMFEFVPAIFYVTDKNWRTLECNNYCAKAFGLESRDHAIGVDNYEIADLLGWEQTFVHNLNQRNQMILESEKLLSYHVTADLRHGKSNLIFYTSPLRNRQNQLIGLTGIGLNLTELARTEHFNTSLNERLASLKLAPRELECLYYYIQGYSSKMISRELNISCHTINSYLQNIKLKTGCRHKSDLLSMIFPKIFETFKSF